MTYIAHKRNETDGAEEALSEHLQKTAETAAEFAAPFGGENNLLVSGYFHDIGKFDPAFQDKIKNNKDIFVNHSSVGAQAAFENKMPMAAFCIAGHHSGLPDIGSRLDLPGQATLWGKVKDKSVFDYRTSRIGELNEIINKYAKPENPPRGRDNYGIAFLTHMEHSCLVDADFLCTEEFMSGGSVERGGYDNIKTLLDRFNAHLQSNPFKRPQKPSEQKLYDLRGKILQSCIDAAELDENLLSLTVPTGGGKTLSSFAFALNYAVNPKHPRKRIIYVVPYTSIIEQNARVIREVLGSKEHPDFKNVIEHHSNSDTDRKAPDSETARRAQLACENWDAPVIFTTAVQFFESVYANRPGKSRKLHNICESVIIFDEAQMLPIDYLRPCVWAINELAQNFNATAVLCTATQPNLDDLFGERRGCGRGEFKITEICGRLARDCVDDFRRTRFVYDGKVTDEALAESLRNENQALCVVNTKNHAEKLYKMLGEGEDCICLTTRKYPKHRRGEIEELRRRLAEGLKCRVISTSLIEAGVDVDFGTVYRELAGIDSILQAGGRCNRENKRPIESSVVHTFECADGNGTPARMSRNAAAAREVIKKYGGDIYKPQAIGEYFERLYYLENAVGSEKSLGKRIVDEYKKLNFKTVSDSFKLIDSGTTTVYIPTEENRSLIEALRRGHYNRRTLRELEQYAVNLYEHEFAALDGACAVEKLDGGLYVLTKGDYYSKKTGIIFPKTGLGNAIIY